MIRNSDALLMGLMAAPTGSSGRYGAPAVGVPLPPEAAKLQYRRAPPIRRTLRIGLDCSLHWGQARKLVTNFRKDFPDVGLTIADVDEVIAAAELASGDLDAAVLVHGRIAPGLRSTSLWSERLIAVVPDGHHLAENNGVTVEELRQEPILLAGEAPQHAGLREAIARALGGAPLLFAEQPVARDTLFALVAFHFGVTVVPGASTGAFYPGVSLRPIHSDAAEVAYDLLWNPGSHNPALHEFIRFAQAALRNGLNDLSGRTPPAR